MFTKFENPGPIINVAARKTIRIIIELANSGKLSCYFGLFNLSDLWFFPSTGGLQFCF